MSWRLVALLATAVVCLVCGRIYVQKKKRNMDYIDWKYRVSGRQFIVYISTLLRNTLALD